MLIGVIGKKLERTLIEGSFSIPSPTRLHVVNSDVSKSALQQYPSRFDRDARNHVPQRRTILGSLPATALFLFLK
jgi:hypothetical protein